MLYYVLYDLCHKSTGNLEIDTEKREEKTAVAMRFKDNIFFQIVPIVYEFVYIVLLYLQYVIILRIKQISAFYFFSKK